MSLKEIIGISLISMVLFPIVILGVLLATGVVHLEVGGSKDRETLREAFQAAETEKQDSAEASQLKTFKALEDKAKIVEGKDGETRREIERLENLKLETIREKDEILKHRRRIEELVLQNSELQDKQIASLAEVYGAMRPDEAAPILLSLQDPMVVKILKKIPEARATSKLLASLASLDVRRAARITELMGKAPISTTTAPVQKPEIKNKEKPVEPAAPAVPHTKA